VVSRRGQAIYWQTWEQLVELDGRSSFIWAGPSVRVRMTPASRSTRKWCDMLDLGRPPSSAAQVASAVAIPCVILFGQHGLRQRPDLDPERFRSVPRIFRPLCGRLSVQ
jgi:hypothetical protein